MGQTYKDKFLRRNFKHTCPSLGSIQVQENSEATITWGLWCGCTWHCWGAAGPCGSSNWANTPWPPRSSRLSALRAAEMPRQWSAALISPFWKKKNENQGKLKNGHEIVEQCRSTHTNHFKVAQATEYGLEIAIVLQRPNSLRLNVTRLEPWSFCEWHNIWVSLPWSEAPRCLA